LFVLFCITLHIEEYISYNSSSFADNEADVSRVRLSREELLRVTSQELEEFAARAAAEQPLTPEEMREIKRQRRLIKNREYAQMSRGKKKIYLQELETRFNEIEAENYDMRIQIEELNNRVAMLEAENEQLRQQLAYYECKIHLCNHLFHKAYINYSNNSKLGSWHISTHLWICI